MDNWFDSMPGGTHYVGHCPTCGEPNSLCTDSLCEQCSKEQPRRCPLCGCNYSWTAFTEHGICEYCLDIETEMLETMNEPSLVDRIKFRIQEEEEFSRKMIRMLQR